MSLFSLLTRPAQAAPPVLRPRKEPPPLARPRDEDEDDLSVIALPPPRQIPARFDLTHVSPKRFAEIAHELYLEGVLRWPEYQLVGFPSELHPNYDATIGALTGQKANPDRPRNMLAALEDRVDFMRRFKDPDLDLAERALEALRHEGQPRPI